MQFDYDADEPGGQILSWFKKQLKAIATLWDAELPEALLIVVYSGIDAFGLLAAPPKVLDANRTTFKQWCEDYILPRLQTVEGGAITAVDLYAARCGVLHTSTPLSSLERDGNACQLFYEFKGKTGVNMILSARQMPLRVDIEKLTMAFKEGDVAFLKDLQNDTNRLKAADERAQHFLRWVTVVK
jgi:hypothetical protein